MHMKNSTLVVGETFCMPYAACQVALVASRLLFSLQPLDIIAIRLFRDCTILVVLNLPI